MGSDSLELLDAEGGTRLEVESVDEDRGYSVYLTMHPPAEHMTARAMHLFRDQEETLATWLLKDLVVEGASAIALTPEDHRILADLGIEKRPDGKWGFRLKCANKRCGNHVATCFCAEGLLEAVYVAATDRANEMCSVLCWVARGWLHEYLVDHRHVINDRDPDAWLEDEIGWTATELWMEMHPKADREAVDGEKSLRDALLSLTEAWRYRNDFRGATELREDLEGALQDAVSEVYEAGAGDYDPHPNECACPTGGGS